MQSIIHEIDNDILTYGFNQLKVNDYTNKIFDDRSLLDKK